MAPARRTTETLWFSTRLPRRPLAGHSSLVTALDLAYNGM